MLTIYYGVGQFKHKFVVVSLLNIDYCIGID